MSMKSVPQPEDPPAIIVTNSSVENDNTLKQYSIVDWQHVHSVNVLLVQKSRTLLQFVMDMVIFRMIFFELLVFFTFTLLTLHSVY